MPITKVELRTRITGFIEKQLFRNGSAVKKGDVIFTIQKTQYEAEVLAAQGTLEKAQAELEDTTINYNRQKYLASRSAVSQRDFDLAAALLKNAEGGVKLAQASLIDAKLNLSYTQIVAPFDGVIGITRFYPGNLVFSTSEPIIDIVMMDPILVEFNVVEQDILDYLEKKVNDSNLMYESNLDVIKKQLSVYLKMSNGKFYSQPGEIYYFDNTIDPMTGSVLMRAIFNNPSKILLPGAYAIVILESKKAKPELLIPQDSVQTDQLGNYVYTVDSKNIIQYKRIKLGMSYGNAVSVKSGLTEGELVVYQGMLKVHKGSKVDVTVIKYEKTDRDTELAGIPCNQQPDNKLGERLPVGVMSVEIQGDLSPKMENVVREEIENGYRDMELSIEETKKISSDDIVRTDIKDGNLKNVNETPGDESPGDKIENKQY